MNILVVLKTEKDMVKVCLWKYGVKYGHGEFIFEKTKMKISGEWGNGKIIKVKWIFPNGVYFEGPFVNNFPK